MTPTDSGTVAILQSSSVTVNGMTITAQDLLLMLGMDVTLTQRGEVTLGPLLDTLAGLGFIRVNTLTETE